MALSRPGNAVKPGVTELLLTRLAPDDVTPSRGAWRRGRRPRCPLMDMEWLRPRHRPP
jgi:hypothetical protein